MALQKLDLNKTLPGCAGVNFSDKNAVEHFIEGEQFRPCANLQCDSVDVPVDHVRLYMPMCLESRFAKEGQAQWFDMPNRDLPLSPVTYMSIPASAGGISCPADYPGFKSRTMAKVEKVAEKIHVKDGVWAAFWAWVMKAF